MTVKIRSYADAIAAIAKLSYGDDDLIVSPMFSWLSMLTTDPIHALALCSIDLMLVIYLCAADFTPYDPIDFVRAGLKARRERTEAEIAAVQAMAEAERLAAVAVRLDQEIAEAELAATRAEARLLEGPEYGQADDMDERPAAGDDLLRLAPPKTKPRPQDLLDDVRNGRD